MQRARPPEHGRGHVQAGSQPVAEPRPRPELLLPEGHRHPAPFRDRELAHGRREHPLGGPRLRVDPAQPEPVRDLDREPVHDQPVPRDLRPAVRSACEQSDHIARRPELELHDPGRSHASPAHRHRVLHGPDLDRGTRCRQRLLRLPGHAEPGPGPSLVQGRSRGVLREHRPRHAARQLRGLHVQRDQDRERLRRFPPGPAQQHDAGRARPEDGQRVVLQLVRPGRLPRPPASDAEPGPALRRAVPVHGPRRPQARLRPRTEVPGVPDGTGGPALPGRPRHPPRHREHRLEQHRPAHRRRVGSLRRRPDRRARRLRHLLRQHHRQRVEHHRGQPALHGPPALPEGVHALGSLPQHAGGEPLPLRLRPGEPPLHAARPGLRPVARLRLAVHLPDELHRREAASPGLQRERVLRGSRSDARCRRASTRTTPSSGREPPRPTSTRGGPTSPASSARPACSSPSSPPTTTASR